MVKCFLLGDSHTRSYNNISNVIPIFLGPGSKIGIQDTFLKYTFMKINEVIESRIISSNDIVIINIGCPDILRSVFPELNYPHKTYRINQWNKISNRGLSNVIIDKLIENYDSIIQILNQYYKNVYILSATTSFYPIINTVRHFNSKLQDKYGSQFIDLFKYAIHNDRIKEEYLNFNFRLETNYKDYKDYEYDPLHLNNSISKLLGVYIEKHITKQCEFFPKKNLFRNILILNIFNCYSFES